MQAVFAVLALLACAFAQPFAPGTGLAPLGELLCNPHMHASLPPKFHEVYVRPEMLHFIAHSYISQCSLNII